MGWEAWVTLAVVAGMVVALVRNWGPADMVMLGAVAVLSGVQMATGTGKLPGPARAFGEFGNEAVVTVGVLFVVVAGLTQTGAMSLLTGPLLGRPGSVAGVQLRLMGPVVAISAVLNNTPVVAMFMPVVGDWCKKRGFSPSKLFIPLSYAAVLGGVCTMIGTSTNLVVNGLWMKTGQPSFRLFDIAWVGVPVAVAGLLYMVGASRWLLPNRRPAVSTRDDAREYSVEMIVEAGGPVAGKTIEEAGLRHLPGMYLMEIDRRGAVIPAVGHRERLEGDDRLVFVGVVDSVIDLQRHRGLAAATGQVFKLDSPREDRVLVEAVVSNSCRLVGKSIREGRFRTVYNAAVIAVARNGERLKKKIGDIVLQPGDTLLLEAGPTFAAEQRDSRDFFLVSAVEGATPPRHDRAWASLLILVAMVVVAGFGWASMLGAAVVAAGLMILTRCCTGREARKSVDWSVLLAIGASLGLGGALETSGAARAVTAWVFQHAGRNPWAALAMVYLVTVVMTELLSNNAAAAVLFPFAVATAKSLGVDARPFVMAIMVAASCGFALPMGYQTHLMVYGPGGYRASDFLRIGLPLDLLCGVVAVGLAPVVWPFYG